MSYSYIQNPVTGQLLNLNEREAIQVLKQYVRTFQNHLRVQKGGFEYINLFFRITDKKEQLLDIDPDNWARQANVGFFSRRTNIPGKRKLFAQDTQYSESEGWNAPDIKQIEKAEENNNKNAYGATFGKCSNSTNAVLIRLPCRIIKRNGTLEARIPFQIKNTEHEPSITHLIKSLNQILASDPSANWIDHNPVPNLTFHYYALTYNNDNKEETTIDLKKTSHDLKSSHLNPFDALKVTGRLVRILDDETKFGWIVNFSMGSTTSQVFIVKHENDQKTKGTVKKVFLCGEKPVGYMSKDENTFKTNFETLWKQITTYLKKESSNSPVLVKFYNSVGYAFGPDRNQEYTPEGEVLRNEENASMIQLPITGVVSGNFGELNTVLHTNIPNDINMTVGLISKAHAKKNNYKQLLGPDASWAKHF